jgi:hypothetical protein
MVRGAGDHQVEAEVRRSGFIDWDGSAADGQGLELVILPVLWLVNWLTHLIAFRGGWTVRVYAADSNSIKPVRKSRYRSKVDALADVDRQIRLARAPEVPQNDPEQPSTTPAQ